MGKDVSGSSVGARIKKVRENLGMTQAKLATDAEVTAAAISQIEAGDRVPSSPILRKIAAVLAVSTDFLLGKTEKSEIEDLLQNDRVQKFFRGFSDLNAKDKELIEQQIEFLKSKNKK